MSSSLSDSRGTHDLNALAAYVDQELDAEERSRVERHLAGCPECRATLATYARASAAERPTVAAPGAASFSISRGWLAFAASVLVAAGVSLYVSNSSPRPEPGGGTGPSPTPAPKIDAPPAATSPVPAVQPPSSPASPNPPSGIRNGEVQIDGKTLRLEAGAWVDASYDPLKLLPVTNVSSAGERARLIQEKPAIKAYADLGPQVTVVLDGIVYRFDVR